MNAATKKHAFDMSAKELAQRVNDLLMAVGAPLGSDNYFAIREVLAEALRGVPEKHASPPETLPGGEEVWVCRDGRRIPVGELEVDHMRAILRMILKSTRKRAQRNAALQAHLDSLADFEHHDRIWGSD
jgi:hypothetical protein